MKWWRGEWHGRKELPPLVPSTISILVVEMRVAAVSLPDDLNAAVGTLWAGYKKRMEEHGWKFEEL